MWGLAMQRTPLTSGSTNEQQEVREVSLARQRKLEPGIVCMGWDFLDVTSGLLL